MELSLWACIPLALLVVFVAGRLTRREIRLPPSPPSHPVIGHALKIPKSETWKTFANWGKLYGTIVFVKALGRTLIIINSASVARDLMEKKSGNFSDRPRLALMDMMGWNVHLPFLPYGSVEFRKQRRAMQQYLGPSVVHTYDRIMEERTRIFLHRLSISPDTFHQEVHGHIGSIVVKVVYGHEVAGNPADDPLIKLNERVLKLTLGTGTLGVTSIDVFPFLRHVPAWVPGMGLKRKALQVRELLQLVNSTPFERVKLERAAGTTNHSIVDELLNENDGSSEIIPEEDLHMKHFAGTFYNVGTDTTGSALKTFFLMIVLNRDVQQRAQKEIDEVIGPDCFVSFSDRPKLPYIDCILKEVLRIHPPGILGGPPHQSVQVDEYRGWTIPPKSVIISNIWNMMRDDTIFSNPEIFDPDRHSVRGNARNGTEDLISPVFGFGRRSCPGRAFAEAMLWITMANVLATFDILPCKDPATGEDVPPIVEFAGEIISSVKPFKCRIVQRGGRLAQTTGGV